MFSAGKNTLPSVMGEENDKITNSEAKSTPANLKVAPMIGCALLGAAIGGCAAAIIMHCLAASITLWIVAASAAGGSD
ncbi:MAG: hypothetical protein LBI69_01435 [Puniceicoccales bacterium]|nr:hypothetical protein [Puniceicoccales bacterium]